VNVVSNLREKWEIQGRISNDELRIENYGGGRSELVMGLLRKVFRSSFPISIRLGSRFAAKLQPVSHELRIAAAELRIMDYGLWGLVP
jgi:hypothetical protein